MSDAPSLVSPTPPWLWEDPGDPQLPATQAERLLTAADLLHGTFVFSATPEGFDCWNGVHTKLQAMARLALAASPEIAEAAGDA